MLQNNIFWHNWFKNLGGEKICEAINWLIHEDPARAMNAAAMDLILGKHVTNRQWVRAVAGPNLTPRQLISMAEKALEFRCSRPKKILKTSSEVEKVTDLDESEQCTGTCTSSDPGTSSSDPRVCFILFTHFTMDHIV